MPRKEIPNSAIEAVAQQINARSTKNHGINVVGNAANIETPKSSKSFRSQRSTRQREDFTP